MIRTIMPMRAFYHREFKTFVKTKGYGLLRDDFNFIEKLLSNKPESIQREALRGYLTEWNAVVAGEIKNASKRSVARFKANTWLREWVNGLLHFSCE